MTYQSSHHRPAPRHQSPRDADALDTSLLDQEFDDLLDRQVDAIRESLADFRNL
jgi:hypothetical protein